MEPLKMHPNKPSLWRQWVTSTACAALLAASAPAPLLAQQGPPQGGPPPGAQGPGPQGPGPQGPGAQASDQQGYSPEQLDAVLAPIALYPDQLLTQVLMASAFPDQVTAAEAWCQAPGNKALQGDALTAALAPLPWDPSVKSLVPFSQVLATMTSQPDWLQQLGYAMSVQQPAVMESVQRLRRQAQIAGQLNSTPQQQVSTQGSAIVIEPAQPNVVYVPAYNPAVVYGAWPYPAYPPFYLPPPPGFYLGGAVVGGFAFGIGIGITAGLWGWAHPNWGGGNVYINVNRYNSISVNRPWVGGATWRPVGATVGRPAWGYRQGTGYRPGAGGFVPPGGAGYRPVAPGYRPPVAGIRPPAPIARPAVEPGRGVTRPGTVPGAGTRPQNGTRPGGATPPAGHHNGGTRPGSHPTGRPSHAAPAARPAEPGRGAPAERPRPEAASRPAAPSHAAPAGRPAGGERPKPAARQGGNGGNKKPK